jgi:hypothetical protein
VRFGLVWVQHMYLSSLLGAFQSITPSLGKLTETEDRRSVARVPKEGAFLESAGRIP